MPLINSCSSVAQGVGARTRGWRLLMGGDEGQWQGQRVGGRGGGGNKEGQKANCVGGGGGERRFIHLHQVADVVLLGFLMKPPQRADRAINRGSQQPAAALPQRFPPTLQPASSTTAPVRRCSGAQLHQEKTTPRLPQQPARGATVAQTRVQSPGKEALQQASYPAR